MIQYLVGEGLAPSSSLWYGSLMAVRRSRQNAGRRPWYNDEGVPVSASKTKRRKGRWLRNWWGSRHKSNRIIENRRERRQTKIDLHREVDT